MDLMSGLPMFIQLGLLLLSSLFIFISYGTGTWWTNTHLNYEMSFSLWKLCSNYMDHETCLSITGDYLESVILALRGCMGIVMLCMIILIVLHGIHLVARLRNSANSDDYFLHARTLVYLMFIIFSVASLAHSHHCPPCYFVGKTKMASSVAWGWYLSLVAFLMVCAPTGIHCHAEFKKWRSSK